LIANDSANPRPAFKVHEVGILPCVAELDQRIPQQLEKPVSQIQGPNQSHYQNQSRAYFGSSEICAVGI
jgi:hypothetical protein